MDKSDASLTNKLAIRFLALTVVRSRSVRFATWDQFDLDDAVWEIPDDLVKSRERFRVMLSRQALNVLRLARVLNPNSELVFPNRSGKPFSDSTYSKLFRELKIPAVPHGFRSSFSEWGHRVEQADYAVVESSLAHLVGNEVYRAYQRSDFWEERGKLMQNWGDIVGHTTAFNVDTLDASGDGDIAAESSSSRRSERSVIARSGDEMIAGASSRLELRSDPLIAADS